MYGPRHFLPRRETASLGEDEVAPPFERADGRGGSSPLDPAEASSPRGSAGSVLMRSSDMRPTRSRGTVPVPWHALRPGVRARRERGAHEVVTGIYHDEHEAAQAIEALVKRGSPLTRSA